MRTRPALIAALLLAPACAVHAAPQDKKFYLVLVDETTSFLPFWRESLNWTGRLIERLGSDDGIGVIGIDDRGFDPDDVRFPLRTLDPAPLRAVGQKRTWAKQVRVLERRKAKSNYTDVLGAVRHAAYFLKGRTGFRPVVVIFSDMDQTPRMPRLEDAKDLRFPAGTEVYCTYVNASGWADNIKVPGWQGWDSIVNRWLAIFTGAGAKMTKDNFYQQGNWPIEFDRIVPSN